MRLCLPVIALLAVSLAFPACRSPKKVLTERDKQQVKDSLLPEAPTGVDIIPVAANFDDKLELVSYSLNKQRVKPGDAIALTIYWKSTAPVDGDYKIFVHLDSTTARKTYDHYAVNGLYPTANWKPGEVLKDEINLQIDQKFPGGPAKLWLGMFDAKAWKEEKKNVRLTIKNPGSVRADKQNRLLLTAFMVGDIENKDLVVKKAAAKPAIDGKFDEDGWKQAFIDGGSFYATDGKALPAAEAVQAGLMWDEENLYLGFKVLDKDLRTPYKDRDSTLWSGGKKGASDVVEVFYDPDGDGANYLEMQISPAGVVFDAVFDSYRSPAWKKASAFNMDFTYKVTVTGTLNDGAADTGYDLEVSVPWKQLPGLDGPPAAGQIGKINFFRLSNSGTWAGAWSPVGNDFHDMSLAGTVTFAK